MNRINKFAEVHMKNTKKLFKKLRCNGLCIYPTSSCARFGPKDQPRTADKVACKHKILKIRPARLVQ